MRVIVQIKAFLAKLWLSKKNIESDSLCMLNTVTDQNREQKIQGIDYRTSYEVEKKIDDYFSNFRNDKLVYILEIIYLKCPGVASSDRCARRSGLIPT